MTNQSDASKNEFGYEGNEYLPPLNFSQQLQFQQALQSFQTGQNIQNQQLQSQQIPQQLLFPAGEQSFKPLDESNPSLVYDRTIKVAKTNYADRGTHGIAALPFHEGQGLPPQSVHMQLQLQQRIQQQQQQQQQQSLQIVQNQFNLNAMMPPPNVMLPQQPQQQQQGVPYPSLVPGSLGSQQFFRSLVNDAESGNASASSSATGLIEALNAQLTAVGGQFNANMGTAAVNAGNFNHGGGRLADNLLVAAAAGVSQLGNLGSMPNLSNLGSMPNLSNLGSLPSLSNLTSIANTTNMTNSAGWNSANHPITTNQNNADTIAPGDVRYGKKRVSPSVPLHPSQLQLPHHGGGLLVSGASGYTLPTSNKGMKSVAEEEESGANNNGIDRQNPQNSALYSSTINALNSYIEKMGGVATSASIGQMPPQSQLTPAEQGGGYHIQAPHLGQPALALDPVAVAQVAQALQTVERVGDALTNPSEPAANSGLDNSEGNLIVRRGDVFKIPKKNIHYHPPSSKDKKIPSSNKNASDEILEYTALSLLGQGTFAQVFHCIEKKTGRSVAIKIVKNKPAYTRQAAVEIDVFRKLNADEADGDDNDSSMNDDGTSSPATKSESSSVYSSISNGSKVNPGDSIIRLMYYFMHCSHLCLVFEMLGPNLYELLKKRQFRGLPIGAVRTLIRQATEGVKLLGRKKVVHCDLKPENILMVRADAVEAIIAENAKKSVDAVDSNSPPTNSDEEQWIKLIDFGSACFEGQTAHTYIQSRFYRSPEVLIGLPYDSAIDMWSLGCVAAELFLGLPILPGVHEHDQLGRILEMIGDLPEWMLERGTKCSKFFKVVTKRRGAKTNGISLSEKSDGSPSRTTWEFKSRHEYINSLTEEEKQNKGGLAKLEQQPTNRYFKKKRLEDIVMHHGVCNTKKEREQLGLFVHFLKGVLDPDPWKRWTAKQASMHPFLTGSNLYRSKLGEVGADGTRLGAKPYDIHWVPPWDASICRRKLLVVQKTKDKSRRNSLHGSRTQMQQSVPEETAAQNQALPGQGLGMYSTPIRSIKKINPQSPAVSLSSAQVTAMADAMSLNRLPTGQTSSPPQTLEALINAQLSNVYPYPSNLSASLGANLGMGLPINYQPLADANLMGRRFSENLHPSQVAAQQNLQAVTGFSDLAFLPHPPQQPTFMGAQSFSGAYYDGMPSHYPHVEGELGYALQRPGVFPISGNDAVAILQRQSSNPSLAFLAQQNAMLSSSFSNVSSTPRSIAQSSGSMSFQSPGDLLQSFGLHDQGSYDHNYSQFNTGSNAATSLLAQQLAEYSEPDRHQQNINSQNSNVLQLARQQSDLSTTSGMYGSTGPQMYGSYHGIANYAALAGPMSLSSLPPMHSASLGNYGGNLPDRQDQNYLAQLNSQLMNMQHATQNQTSLQNLGEHNGVSDLDLKHRHRTE